MIILSIFDKKLDGLRDVDLENAIGIRDQYIT